MTGPLKRNVRVTANLDRRNWQIKIRCKAKKAGVRPMLKCDLIGFESMNRDLVEYRCGSTGTVLFQYP